MHACMHACMRPAPSTQYPAPSTQHLPYPATLLPFPVANSQTQLPVTTLPYPTLQATTSSINTILGFTRFLPFQQTSRGFRVPFPHQGSSQPYSHHRVASRRRRRRRHLLSGPRAQGQLHMHSEQTYSTYTRIRVYASDTKYSNPENQRTT
ncbi:hypothetical protein BO71DRAFT_165650 [Aspergillus ellipticus CBS 707.79]|uniref:Uncharacterized protein n=1 Tax=Aspergillus ellipticus CBS 707.79 TaxID=1448320 RepID=A0A319CQV4_9EURO|nr:hypothetical protein BO71DRAFT_165650 [Aspergillus ellipticus CBS 707.79]